MKTRIFTLAAFILTLTTASFANSTSYVKPRKEGHSVNQVVQPVDFRFNKIEAGRTSTDSRVVTGERKDIIERGSEYYKFQNNHQNNTKEGMSLGEAGV